MIHAQLASDVWLLPGPLHAGSRATSPGKVQQDMAGEAATTAAPQSTPTSNSVARAAQYNLYDLGESRLMVRSHETACMREVGAGEGGSGSTYPSLQPVIVRAKMEYIPKQGPEQVRMRGLLNNVPQNIRLHTGWALRVCCILN